jgi:hypothetical protein
MAQRFPALLLQTGESQPLPHKTGSSERVVRYIEALQPPVWSTMRWSHASSIERRWSMMNTVDRGKGSATRVASRYEGGAR